MNVKVVIICHNTPETTEKLYSGLSQCFDVTVFDSGSDEDKRPKCPADTFQNLYWPGCWREAMKRYGGADFLWVVGGDVSLMKEPAYYHYALNTMTLFNVGCWSPCVSGKCRDVMSADKAAGRVWNVYHLEGQALALSKEVMKMVDFTIPESNKLGWGVDFWFCWKSWKAGMRNVLDGRVSIYHPEVCGYNPTEALSEMAGFLALVGGPNWGPELRAHPYFERFENNLREVGV